MSTPPYVSRHAKARRGPLTRLKGVAAAGPRTAAKGVAGAGLVVGAVTLAVASPTSAADGPEAGASGSAEGATAQLQLADRSGEGASRSQARTAVTAPKSSKAAKAASSEFGTIEIEPVKKKVQPKPEPEPEETEETDEAAETEQAEESQSSSTESADSTESSSESSGSESPATGNYAAEASELGLGPSAQAVYSAVRTKFPHLTNIGGYRAGDPGDHGTGNAVDIMCGTADGDAVAAYVQANASSLNVKYVIWKQRIWLPGQGWRTMEDRGSATANHYDHVHVSVG